jgi:hypothetical protein
MKMESLADHALDYESQDALVDTTTLLDMSLCYTSLRPQGE